MSSHTYSNWLSHSTCQKHYFMAQLIPLLIESSSLHVPSGYEKCDIWTSKSLTWNFGECMFPEFRSVFILKHSNTYIEFYVLTPNENLSLERHDTWPDWRKDKQTFVNLCTRQKSIFNRACNVRINVILRSVRATIVVVEKQ